MKKVFPPIMIFIMILSTFSTFVPLVKSEATSSTSDPTDDLYTWQSGSPAPTWSVIDIVYAEVSQINSTHINLLIRANQAIPLSNQWQGYLWLLDTGVPAPPYGMPIDSNDLTVDYSVTVCWAAYGALSVVVYDWIIGGAYIYYEDARSNPEKYFSTDTCFITIPLSLIGNPASIKWVACSTDGVGDSSGRHDKAPNTGHATLTIAPTVAPDFSISVSPSVEAMIIRSGGWNSTISLVLQSINGFEGLVELTYISNPSINLTFTENPVYLSPSITLTVRMNVSANPSLSLGTYSLVLEGRSNTLSHQLSVEVVIKGCVGAIMNLVRFDNIGRTNSSFSVQQNFLVQASNGTVVYWCQNVVLLEKLPFNRWLISSWFNIRDRHARLIRGPYPLARKIVRPPFSLNLTSLITGNKLVMVNNATFIFNSKTLTIPSESFIVGYPDRMPQLFPMFGNVHQDPEIVVVGPSGGRTIRFLSDTAGNVQSFLKLVNSDEWMSPIKSRLFIVIPLDWTKGNFPQTGEYAVNLQWTQDGSFSYVPGELYQGLAFHPNFNEA